MQVDSIAHDERTLICTVFQHRRATLARPLDTVEMVQLAETAVAPLLSAGYRPMITAVDWAHGEELRNASDRPDPEDPLGLITALKEAGLPHPRLNIEAREETSIIPLPFWRKALGLFA
jgi:hypothetical protein